MQSIGAMIIAPDDPGPAPPEQVWTASVVKVFDGDGFLADVWDPSQKIWVERIPFRLAFVDAPEMAQPFGHESKNFLHDLIFRRSLRLDPVGKASIGYLPIDPYKRMLCMAFLTNELGAGQIEYFFDGRYGAGSVRKARPITRNIELEMVVNGWAWVTEQYAFDRSAEYFAAQNDARRNRRGFWATENPEPPWSFKRRLKRRREAPIGQRQLI